MPSSPSLPLSSEEDEEDDDEDEEPEEQDEDEEELEPEREDEEDEEEEDEDREEELEEERSDSEAEGRRRRRRPRLLLFLDFLSEELGVSGFVLAATMWPSTSWASDGTAGFSSFSPVAAGGEGNQGRSAAFPPDSSPSEGGSAFGISSASIWESPRPGSWTWFCSWFWG